MSRRRPGSKHHARLHKRRWEKVRKVVFERDGWRCLVCLGSGRLECHHRQALADGGKPYALENLETRCRSCHLSAEHHRPDPEREAWRILVRELAAEQ